jgi:CheY-like chemotaxis protein
LDSVAKQRGCMTRPTLLLEDDENDIFFMRRAWKQAGILHPLFVLEDGQAGIDYLRGAGRFADREKYPLPYLLLLDLKLPKLSGKEVLSWIREQPEWRTLIVIALSSSSLDKDINDVYQLGANSFLAKPSTPDKRLALVKQVNDYWLELNREAVRPFRTHEFK